jgi:hypothetical protein
LFHALPSRFFVQQRECETSVNRPWIEARYSFEWGLYFGWLLTLAVALFTTAIKGG